MDSSLSQTSAPQEPSMHAMPPAPERSLASKMLWPLVSLVVVAAVAIGFAYWWTNRADDRAAVNVDPKEAVIQGMSKLVAAKDGEFVLEFPFDSFIAVDDATAQAQESTLVVQDAVDDRERFKGMVLGMSGAWAQTGATSTQGRFDFDVASEKINIKFLGRSFNGDELYIQLAKFQVPEMPIDLSALTGTWISVNIRQMLNDFGAGLGAAAEGNAELMKLVQEQPTRFVVSDRATYGALFGDVMRRHDIVTYALVSEGKYRLGEKEGVTKVHTDAFVADMVQTFVQQYLRDIDAAIASTKKAGDTTGTAQLEAYRKELVSEAGEDGSKAVKELRNATTDLEESSESNTKEAGEVFVTLHPKTGALERITLQPTVSASGKDLRSVKPAEITFSKLNSGLRIERPTPSKTVYEMIPVFMGLMAGAGGQMDTK